MMENRYDKRIYIFEFMAIFVVLIAFFCLLPTNAFAIDDVKDCVNPEHYGVENASDIKDKQHEGEINESCYSNEDRENSEADDVIDCVNPEHYGVKRASDIKDKKHEGEKNDGCYTQEERDEKIKQEFEAWKKAVKEVNEEYTKVYNAYEKSLHEEIEIDAELAEQDKLIAEKQEQLERATAAAYKQNYQGKLLVSLIIERNLKETLNLKKYMDSTLEYINNISDELKAERQKKQTTLDEVNAHIQKAKDELIDAASHINDKIPDASQELKDYIDSHGTENFKEGRTLVDKNLSDDWLIDVALYYVGTPYVWGGKGETGADCSGFTSMVYKSAEGKNIGVNTSNQYAKLEHVDKSKLERGDVLFMANEKDASQEHVGIYLEGDKYIHNSGTGTLSKVDTGIDYFSCGLRVNDKMKTDESLNSSNSDNSSKLDDSNKSEEIEDKS